VVRYAPLPSYTLTHPPLTLASPPGATTASLLTYSLTHLLTRCNYFKSGNHSGEYAAGLNLMGSNSLLNSMLWCCILVYVIDRKWLHAALACCGTAVFAAFMIIHQPKVRTLSDPDPSLTRHSIVAALMLTLIPQPFAPEYPNPDPNPSLARHGTLALTPL